MKRRKAAEGLGPTIRRSDPRARIAHLLARAGYLADADRVVAKAGLSPAMVSKEHALHGDLNGALAAIRAEPDILWRVGWLDGL